MANTSNNNDNLTVPDSNPYFQDFAASGSGRARSNSVRSQLSQRSGVLTPLPENVALDATTERRDYDRRPSIRIRRLSSVQNAVPGAFPAEASVPAEGTTLRRNRSLSEPQRGTASRLSGRESYMPNLQEETTSPTTGTPRIEFPVAPEQSTPVQQTPPPVKESSMWRPLRRARTNIGQEKEREREGQDDVGHTEYEEDLVDLLDLVGEFARREGYRTEVNPNQIRKSQPSKPSPTSKTPSSSPIWGNT